MGKKFMFLKSYFKNPEKCGDQMGVNQLGQVCTKGLKKTTPKSKTAVNMVG